jgi:hypothetical protein
MLKPERMTGCEPILRALFDVHAGEERVLTAVAAEGLTASWQSLASFCGGTPTVEAARLLVAAGHRSTPCPVRSC